MMFRKEIPLLFLLLLNAMHYAWSQQLEVKTYFDAQKQTIKEVYQIDKNKSNQINGFYKAYYPNGPLEVEGFYNKGIAEGEWKYYYQSGSLKMSGTMKGESPQGHWEYYYENNNKSMEGTIEAGNREGFWTFYYENGNKKSEGKFEKGKKDGLWHYYYEDGTLKAKGLYQGREGKYKEYFPSGNLRATGFKLDGKSDSLWTFFYENAAKMAEGYYQEGLKSGEWIFFHLNGNVASKGTYVQGEKEGHWQYFDDNGLLNTEGLEKDDKKEGFWKMYFEDGGLKGEVFFNKGSGIYKEYYISGKLRKQGVLEDDLKQGKWLYYYENGRLEGEADFVNGLGTFIGYYETGEVKMKGSIENNQRIGTWTLYKQNGSIAGYYKIVYHAEGYGFEEIAADNSAHIADTVKYEKPEYKFKSNESKYFKSRLNEFRGIIIGLNPMAVAIGSIPLSLEYYIQERLGHELQLTLIRDPFFSKDTSMPLHALYKRGFSAAFRQKFYQSDQELGMIYFAHELRFTRVEYKANVPASNTAPSNTISILNEDASKYEYSFIVGDRITKDPGEKGITLDVFIGVGIGYRKYDALDNVTNGNNQVFDETPKSKFTVPLRVGLSIGYVF